MFLMMKMHWIPYNKQALSAVCGSVDGLETKTTNAMSEVTCLFCREEIDKYIRNIPYLIPPAQVLTISGETQ